MPKISALGLDVGKKRVGVAGCDGTGLIATGLTTIERSSFPRDLERLRELVAERDARVLVVGLPYAMNGEIGEQGRQTLAFARRVSEALGLPVEYVDERLSSVEARERPRRKKRRRARPDKGEIDRQAAEIILQRWLDRGGAGDASPNPLEGQRSPPFPPESGDG